ncbi:hypothetical protein NE237_006282 [Protea cynaroides]|uniref:Uncharacterized protein n=1 Tax=Protea cynaroides TaxID=273540 RepID=A0A9Q0QV57_9MAGN|nr:hypothetical protein NE237_006282 [Protea cynaroides]
MSDRVSIKTQNHPANLKTEYEEEQPTDSWSRVMTPPGLLPLGKTRNWFSSQPSSSSSSRSFHQLNTSFPILSPDGTSINFGHQHLTGQTCPCHMSQPIPLSYILPPISAQPISVCLPTGATDTPQPISSVPSPNPPPTTVPSPKISCRPGSPVIRTCRPHIKKDARSGIRTQRLVEVPDSSIPKPVSGGASSGASQRADHNFPQEIHESHAPTPLSSWPGVTICRSDPRRKMTPKEVYQYVFFSPEWEIEERVRQNGKYKGRIEYIDAHNGNKNDSDKEVCAKTIHVVEAHNGERSGQEQWAHRGGDIDGRARAEERNGVKKKGFKNPTKA